MTGEVRFGHEESLATKRHIKHKMRLNPSLFFLCFLCLFVANVRAAQKIVVAADGSGDFPTVQQALDHVPDNNDQPCRDSH